MGQGRQVGAVGRCDRELWTGALSAVASIPTVSSTVQNHMKQWPSLKHLQTYLK